MPALCADQCQSVCVCVYVFMLLTSQAIYCCSTRMNVDVAIKIDLPCWRPNDKRDTHYNIPVYSIEYRCDWSSLVDFGRTSAR